MTLRDYPINKVVTNELAQEISQWPNFMGTVGVPGDQTSAVFTFDFTDKQEFDFLTWLNNRLGINNTSLAQFTQFPDADWVYGTNVAAPAFVNIGTVFKNVYTVSDGLSFGIDIKKRKELRLQVHWLKIGTGTQTVAIVQKNNPANILATLDVTNGENLGLVVPIPDIFWNTQNRYLIQAKSTVAGDDPQFLGLNLYMR